MSETLCTLRTKGGGGGRYNETSLWTNPSPSSSFASQSVTLSDSIDNYKYIKIKFRLSTSNSTTSETVYLVEDFKTYTSTTALGISGGVVGQPVANQGYVRKAIYSNSTQIQFDTAYRLAVNDANTSYLIPLEILGLNELDHGTKYTTNYDVLQLQTPANTNADFTVTTKGKPISITLFCYNPSNGSSPEVRTNTNPSTGVVDNTDLWRSTNSAKTWEHTTLVGQYWTVTDNSITFQPVGSSRTIAVAYTYE